MQTIRLVWHDYRYFPYERRLAMAEAAALIGSVPFEVDGHVEAPMNGHSLDALRRLTYFREAHLPGGEVVIPDQARLEASGQLIPGRLGPVGPRLSKQATRYSSHGLHEYKGRFNPQVVRAIGNYLGIDQNSLILDPFCGSGTTLVEAAHIGWDAVGVDMNPLAVFLANAKVEALRVPLDVLKAAAGEIQLALLNRVQDLSYSHAWSEEELRSVTGDIPNGKISNVDFLSSWFSPSILAQLTAIITSIERIGQKPVSNLFKAVVSDLLREVSNQEPADLRVRRRKNPLINYPVIPAFLKRVCHVVASIVEARKVIGLPAGYQEAILGDARTSIPPLTGNTTERTFDAAITSPPYATALPYVDTQRFSLCLLGLVSAHELPRLARGLIGTREIATTQRRAFETDLRSGATSLPDSATGLCLGLLDAAQGTEDGFRRRNTPALIYSYLLGMRHVLINVAGSIRKGGKFALLVGQNRTQIGGTEFTIDTPALIGEIAESVGWSLREILVFETYQRYGLHARNAIKNENLVVLQA